MSQVNKNNASIWSQRWQTGNKQKKDRSYGLLYYTYHNTIYYSNILLIPISRLQMVVLLDSNFHFMQVNLFVKKKKVEQ